MNDTPNMFGPDATADEGMTRRQTLLSGAALAISRLAAGGTAPASALAALGIATQAEAQPAVTPPQTGGSGAASPETSPAPSPASTCSTGAATSGIVTPGRDSSGTSLAGNVGIVIGPVRRRSASSAAASASSSV